VNNGTIHNSFELPDGLPVGLTESDLVDLVDGLLPTEREGVVIEALRQHPRLGLLVKNMRADRAEVAELAHTRIAMPTNMLEAVEAKLNRAALSELVAASEEAPSSIPISRVLPMRRSVVSVIAENMWARRIATAASVAIVAGIGYVSVREAAKRWPSMSGLVATNRPTDGSANGRADRPTPDIDSHTPGHTDLARAENTNAVGDESERPSVDVTIAANPSAMVPDGANEPGELTLAELVRMAEAGRLVITVRSTAYEGTLRHLQELSRTANHDIRWRAYETNALPQELAALATPMQDEAAAKSWPGRPGRSEMPVPTFADDGSAPVITTPAMTTFVPGVSASAVPMLGGPAHSVVVRTLRLVQMPADERSLDGLLKDINVVKGHTARFRVLPEANAINAKPPLDPESVLWWSRGGGGGSAWVKRVVVPVVVEMER